MSSSIASIAAVLLRTFFPSFRPPAADAGGVLAPAACRRLAQFGDEREFATSKAVVASLSAHHLLYCGRMAVLEIKQVGDPVLRRPAEALTAEELGSASIQVLIDDMIETMRAANGAGLAAPQVGRSLQVCVIEVNDNPRYPYKPSIPLTVLVNPQLVARTEETFASYEGCLSVPNLRGVVMRNVEMQITALDRHGSPIDAEIRGITAGTYQHEVDHLRGTLFLDRVDDPRTFTTWDEFRAHHESAFASRVKTLVERFGS